MATGTFFGIVKNGNNFSSYSSQWERKVGDRVQVGAGWWGVIIVETPTMQAANAVINAINKKREAEIRRLRRLEKQQEDAIFVSICLNAVQAGIMERQTLVDAGIIKA